MISLIKSFILGRSWILILVIGLISASAAATASWKLKGLIDNQEYSELKDEYQTYKQNVTDSRLAESTAVIDKMSGLVDNMSKLQIDFREKVATDKAFSDLLVKELYEANGKSCPLSPAIEHYLDRLRLNQQSRRVN